MPKWLGNRYGDAVPVNPNNVAPSAIYNLFDQYYMRQEGGYAPVAQVAATGGTEFTNGGYQYHFFDSTSGQPFNVSSAGDVEILVVGGGGGGGGNNGGGGGGGALVNLPQHPVTVQNYTITCGAGGAGSSQPTVRGSNGSNTTACGIAAKGGGGGGSGTETGAGDSNDPFGGSGGGQSRDDSVGQGGSYGNNGGPSDGSSNGRGGGGGGAGGAGSPGGTLKGGVGGPVPWCPGPIFPGMPTTWQTTVGPTGLFAGGGGGNNEPGSGYDVDGGPGGGGAGTGSYQPGGNGLANTGGGGGGTMSSGRTGGSGFVVIRYPE